MAPTATQAFASGDLDGAWGTLIEMQHHTAAARTAGTDPLWRAAGLVPVIGPNFRATTDATVAADTAADALSPLLDPKDGLTPTLFAPKDGRIDLAALEEASPLLARAATSVQSASDSLNAIDGDQLLPQLAAPLSNASDELNAVSSAINGVAEAARILPPMLGSGTPRSYLVLVQNNAEVRASGGIPGALVVLTANGGEVELTDHGSASAIGQFRPALEVDEEQERIYTSRLGSYIQNVNLTPDFPTSAKTARAMWEQANPKSNIDGVLSIDPVALGYLLEATGPVELKRLSSVPSDKLGSLPTSLSSENVVQTLLSDVYREIHDPSVQDSYFAAVAEEIFTSLSTGKIDASKLALALQKVAAEGRLLVWSGIEEEQRVIVNSSVSGAVASTADKPEIGVYFNDGTGAKMDFYVHRQVKLTKRCESDGYYRYAVETTLKNDAPADAGKTLPDYVTGAGVFGVKPGTVQTNIYAYGPTEWFLDSAARDGKAAPFGSYKHDERPVAAATVSLAPGKSTTVEFEFSTPYETDEPTLAVTPTVQKTSEVLHPSTASKDCG